MPIKVPVWTYRQSEEIKPNSLQVVVVADYGGSERGIDPAFNEVHQLIRRFDERGLVKE